MATAVTAANLPVILVVNTDPALAQRVSTAVRRDDYLVETATSTCDAMQRLQRAPLPKMVLMNVGPTPADGLQTLQQALQVQPQAKVIVMGAGDDARSAAQAVRMGAIDYLSNSAQEGELQSLVQKCLNEISEMEAPPAKTPQVLRLVEDINPAERPEIVDLGNGQSFVCASAAMKEIYAQATVIAKFDMPVLMLGQS